jgi:hypothetical protein
MKKTAGIQDGMLRACVDVEKKCMDTDEPTRTQLHLLSRYKRDTHAVQMPHGEAREMERRGWVSWQPPLFGAHNLYYLTDAGRRICEERLWGKG